MKKKTQEKKLKLSKETVQNLETGKLQKVQGGACTSEGAHQRSCTVTH
jgi:hypothetical protein